MLKQRILVIGLAVQLVFSSGVFAAGVESLAEPAVSSAEPVISEEEDGCIGIISAMSNEVSLLLSEADIDHVDEFGGVKYNVGTLCGKDVVIAKAGVGKVLASAGAAAMLNRYDIDRVIFTGVAGGVGDETKVLDIVVATDLVQHDYGMISNDGFEWSKGHIGDGYFHCDPELADIAYDVAADAFGEDHVFQGTIATGDQFIASEEYVALLQKDFNALACEMEGAAVALVCEQYEVPYVVIRTMSDKADGNAENTFSEMADTAADNSCSVVMGILGRLGE